MLHDLVDVELGIFEYDDFAGVILYQDVNSKFKKPFPSCFQDPIMTIFNGVLFQEIAEGFRKILRNDSEIFKIQDEYVLHLFHLVLTTWALSCLNFQVVVPGLHLDLGIFPKMFKLFDRDCRRLDYRLVGHNTDDDQADKILNELFYKEDKIYNFQESLAICTDTYLYQMSQLGDEDDDERKALEETFNEHCKKVEDLLKNLVIFIH